MWKAFPTHKSIPRHQWKYSEMVMANKNQDMKSTKCSTRHAPHIPNTSHGKFWAHLASLGRSYLRAWWRYCPKVARFGCWVHGGVHPLLRWSKPQLWDVWKGILQSPEWDDLNLATSWFFGSVFFFQFLTSSCVCFSCFQQCVDIDLFISLCSVTEGYGEFKTHPFHGLQIEVLGRLESKSPCEKMWKTKVIDFTTPLKFKMEDKNEDAEREFPLPAVHFPKLF